MTEKEIRFISLLRSLDTDKLERYLQILKKLAVEDTDEKDSARE